MNNNYIGEKFNRLTVLEKSSLKSGTSYLWLCKCDCGNETYATLASLRSGHKKSCGCLLQEHRIRLGKSKGKDLKNLRFGNLLVLEKTDKRKDNRIVWKCKCDCGNIIFASSHDLLDDHITHCGCKRVVSKGEQKVAELLSKCNLKFEREKIFSDLKTNGKNLRYDFFVEGKFLIEYDGKQHFIKDSGYGADLENIRIRDNLKTQYAKEHNIPLVHISYLKYDVLQIKDLIPDCYLYLLDERREGNGGKSQRPGIAS